MLPPRKTCVAGHVLGERAAQTPYKPPLGEEGAEDQLRDPAPQERAALRRGQVRPVRVDPEDVPPGVEVDNKSNDTRTVAIGSQNRGEQTPVPNTVRAPEGQTPSRSCHRRTCWAPPP